jgi:hypothetical protein
MICCRYESAPISGIQTELRASFSAVTRERWGNHAVGLDESLSIREKRR